MSALSELQLFYTPSDVVKEAVLWFNRRACGRGLGGGQQHRPNIRIIEQGAVLKFADCGLEFGIAPDIERTPRRQLKRSLRQISPHREYRGGGSKIKLDIGRDDGQRQRSLEFYCCHDNGRFDCHTETIGLPLDVDILVPGGLKNQYVMAALSGQVNHGVT